MTLQVVAVAMVLILLGATLWLLQRRGIANWNGQLLRRAGATKDMSVLERMPLTPNHSLHLVRVLDRALLIGVSPASCTQLADFPIEDVAYGPNETGGSRGQT
ncbi:MAG: flagellar biosynthetic protein FliO [Acidobacteriaceae bacterium]|nr:flagellar biosynthetic protein FliO [Acidobacteriaceae bacterium]MBV9500143.1 flagellar biosynthetic protein FliO [Acidobacteriaceae bacterium]